MIKLIPLRAQAGITGFESPASDFVTHELNLDQLLIDHPSASYIAYADGQSMTGAGIFSGDLLIISRAEKVMHGDVVVANLNGEFVCKQVDKQRAQLLSSAPGYLPYSLKEGDEFQVEGVVIRSIRLHRPLSKVC